MELRELSEQHERVLAAMTEQPSIRRWGWTDIDDPDARRFAIVVDGRPVGLVQYHEETVPDYRHASIDVFVDTAHQGRGLGTEAVRRVAELLFDERDHHRVTIDPAADNEIAIRSYRKAGFRPVGVMEAAWRDPDGNWRDVLLMEQVRRRSSGPSPGPR